MKAYKFTISTSFINCEHEVIEKFDDDVTQEELDKFAEQLVWEYIGVDYQEVKDG